MPLPEKLQTLLARSDHELFLGGACHIFADELTTFFHDQGYRFCAVEAERWIGYQDQRDELHEPKSLVHVLAVKDDVVVDVNGMILADNYFEEYHYTHREFHGSTYYFRKASFRECSRDELFDVENHEEGTSPMSLHRLYLHPEFVSVARSRARLLIEADADRFHVGSGQFRPQKLIRNTFDDECWEEHDDD